MVQRDDNVDYESTPLSRAEYITSIVHLYRGELYRATSWRIRLDNTTNWAVFTTAGILSLSFGDESHSHLVLLVGFLLISIFLVFEARRYRFADIWYSRVRKIEENFYGPILRRDPVSPEREWGALVAGDLFRPSFKISRFRALRSRFVRNYWAIYAVLMIAWSIKVLIHPERAETWSQVTEHLAVGVVPWWASVAFVGGFVVGGVILALMPGEQDENDHWNLSP